MRWFWLVIALWALAAAAHSARPERPGTDAGCELEPCSAHEPARPRAEAAAPVLAQARDGGAPTQAIGEAIPPADPAEPIVVKVGLRIDQITGIDQKAENFGIVADVRLEYLDPKLAFDPEECGCSVKLLHAAEVIALAKQLGTFWPEFYYYNKQGRIFYDVQLAEITPDGLVRYFERVSATLQAPDFDFRRYPFDSQLFFVRIVSFLPESYYVLEPLEGFSGLGEQLGEEEFIASNLQASVDTIEDRSRISFSFEAERHITYYFFRLFVPIIVILTVSWFVFFLRDYSKRVDIAMTNLLLFIAFNFVISGDLPRLGYLTFLDAILASTFVVTGVIVMVNVALRRLEMNERIDLARTIDTYVLWWYPIGYAIGVGTVALYFFS